MPSVNYTPDEEVRLKDLLSRERELACPRCGGGMDRQSVPPRPEVAYVRDRILVICRGCQRSAVFDRRRL